MADHFLPRVGITMGDPAGIGPEIILRVLEERSLFEICRPVIIGDEGILNQTAGEFGIKIPVLPVSSPAEMVREVVNVISLSDLKGLDRGKVSEAAGHASGRYIESAVSLALRGEIDAVVTAPINKESFNLGGFHYPGHTEFLADLTGTADYAMMLMGEKLRVILLTIHCPLMAVAGMLTRDDTVRIIRLADRSLRDFFGISHPRLALASLNPHAGEGGLFGEEESVALLPAAAAARDEGIDVTDPMPSDTLFYKAVRGAYDIVVCPYHDQGLIPLKLLHFDDGVNVTLGLPIIRTSPDHGTAFDIAGRGVANPASMEAAIVTAVAMAKAKRKDKSDVS